MEGGTRREGTKWNEEEEQLGRESGNGRDGGVEEEGRKR